MISRLACKIHLSSHYKCLVKINELLFTFRTKAFSADRQIINKRPTWQQPITQHSQHRNILIVTILYHEHHEIYVTNVTAFMFAACRCQLSTLTVTAHLSQPHSYLSLTFIPALQHSHLKNHISTHFFKKCRQKYKTFILPKRQPVISC